MKLDLGFHLQNEGRTGKLPQEKNKTTNIIGGAQMNQQPIGDQLIKAVIRDWQNALIRRSNHTMEN